MDLRHFAFSGSMAVLNSDWIILICYLAEWAEGRKWFCLGIKDDENNILSPGLREQLFDLEWLYFGSSTSRGSCSASVHSNQALTLEVLYGYQSFKSHLLPKITMHPSPVIPEATKSQWFFHIRRLGKTLVAFFSPFQFSLVWSLSQIGSDYYCHRVTWIKIWMNVLLLSLQQLQRFKSGWKINSRCCVFLSFHRF